jgi:uncharacterized protein YjfI (DUF2170 family)
MDERNYWTIADLATALAGSQEAQDLKISVKFLSGTNADSAIQVTMHEFGDLEAIIGVAPLEIQASVVLDPVASIPQSARFEHNLLRANKLLVLSSFGITEIAGIEHYEIFGQLSGASSLESVLEELNALGRNAIDAAQMMETWKSEAKRAA